MMPKSDMSLDDRCSAVEEQQRLSLLAELGVLDTDPEPGFDALVHAAAALTQCPIALLGLVDGERQWFKARLGFDLVHTPRQGSFCSHAIRSPDLMVVSDARVDPRFANHPLVTASPGICFYAGQPLTVDGLQIGTLCVIDNKPHALSQSARDALRNLGLAASAMLAERRNRTVSAEQQRRLTEFAMVAGDWLWETNAEHRIVWMSSAYGTESPLPEPWTLGQCMADGRVLESPDGPRPEPLTLHQLFEKKLGFARALVQCEIGGELRFLSHSAVCRRAPSGKWNGYRGITRDVTDQIDAARHLQQLTLAQVASEKAAEVRSELLSRVSHELRTPLNAILGFAQLLRVSGPSQPAAEILKSVLHIETAGAHLLALVNDMLDLSSLDEGRLNLDLRPVALPALLAHCIELIEPHARRHGITLAAEITDSLPTVLADARAVKQLLFNLLGNAVKFSNPQSVVRVRLQHMAPDAWVSLAISDAGPGIAAEHLSSLFQPFMRIPTGRQMPQGSGLGLSISQKLVKAMEGTISVSSQPGLGTTFTVTLPADGRPDLTAADNSAFGDLHSPVPVGLMSPVSVLYIEDEPVNALLMQALFDTLPDERTRLLLASNGADGLMEAISAQPQLILLDMNLPDMDGLSVLRALRSDPETAHIPVIAVSADALPEQILRAREAGCQDYWTKPLNLKLAHAALVRLFPATGRT